MAFVSDVTELQLSDPNLRSFLIWLVRAKIEGRRSGVGGRPYELGVWLFDAWQAGNLEAREVLGKLLEGPMNPDNALDNPEYPALYRAADRVLGRVQEAV